MEAARNRLPSTSLGRRFDVSGQALISLVAPALSTPRETADFKVPTVRLASSTDCRGGWTLDTCALPMSATTPAMRNRATAAEAKPSTSARRMLLSLIHI